MDKYEEALAKARAGKPLEEIFPEINESEDERIRKWLIRLVQNTDTNHNNMELSENCKLALAYLEKQKEQTGELSERLNGVMQEYVKAGKDEEEQEYRLKCYQLFWDALGDLDFFEQQERKTSELSEEDEDMLNRCISSIEEAKENRYAYKENDGDTSYDHEIAWLKSLLPLLHWKPSEEQMEALKKTIRLANFGLEEDRRKALESLYEQLKKLM